jgi:hypothetical protein
VLLGPKKDKEKRRRRKGRCEMKMTRGRSARGKIQTKNPLKMRGRALRKESLGHQNAVNIHLQRKSRIPRAANGHPHLQALPQILLLTTNARESKNNKPIVGTNFFKDLCYVCQLFVIGLQLQN